MILHLEMTAPTEVKDIFSLKKTAERTESLMRKTGKHRCIYGHHMKERPCVTRKRTRKSVTTS